MALRSLLWRRRWPSTIMQSTLWHKSKSNLRHTVRQKKDHIDPMKEFAKNSHFRKAVCLPLPWIHWFNNFRNATFHGSLLLYWVLPKSVVRLADFEFSVSPRSLPLWTRLTLKTIGFYSSIKPTFLPSFIEIESELRPITYFKKIYIHIICLPFSGSKHFLISRPEIIFKKIDSGIRMIPQILEIRWKDREREP